MFVKPHELAEMLGGGINAGHILRAIKTRRLQAEPDGLLEAASALARWQATVRPKPTRGPGRPPKSKDTSP